MSASVAASERVKVQVSRVIRAKRERVYEAWTKPEMIQQWFGPKTMKVGSASADLRVGGTYAIEMIGQGRSEDAGQPEARVLATGTYQTIIPNELLCFTWHGTWDPDGESLVTVHFKDVDGGTEVTLIHERLASEGPGNYQVGWTESLEKLARFCEG